MADKILVTGASGFIASHTVIELLNHGYRVRGTVRDLVRAESLKAVIGKHTDKIDALEFAAATLTDPDCWTAAVEGCDGVFHIASPVPVAQPENADEVIVPAREGTLNVLKAAKAAGIKRVVLTSSVAAVAGGRMAAEATYTKDDWTDLQASDITPYAMSKTIAERAAWEFVADGGPELVTVNPAMVFGPALEADYGSSLEALLMLMSGKLPMAPQITMGVVDVRDVASLHRLAYEKPEAAGQRLLASVASVKMLDIANTLRRAFPEKAGKIPSRNMPNLLVRLLANFNKPLASIVPALGRVAYFDIQPARDLGWEPRAAEEAIVDGGRSLIDFKLV